MKRINRYDVWWAMFFAYQFGRAAYSPHPSLPLVLTGLAGFTGIVLVVVTTWGHR